MKVVYWTEGFPPVLGGVETFAEQIVPALQQRGHELVVVTSGKPVDETVPDMRTGVPVWRFRFSTTLDRRDLGSVLQISRRLTELLEATQPDLIHLNTIGASGFFYLQNSFARRIPTLLTLHMPILVAGQPGSMVPQLLDAVDYVVGVSDASLREAVQYVPAIAAHSTVIKNALRSPPLSPGPLPIAPPVLLCVGRLTEQKGFDLAIEVLPRVLARYPEARLLIVGDGHQRHALEQLAAGLGLGEQVQFLGRVSHAEVYELMNRATMLLIPSRFEPFGLVALEAAQMARPVVASRVGGLAEIVVSGETGLLVEPEQRDALADAVLSLLDQPATCTRYGLQAEQRAREVFDFERFVAAYDALYCSIGDSK